MRKILIITLSILLFLTFTLPMTEAVNNFGASTYTDTFTTPAPSSSGYVYAIDRNGVLKQLNATTGEVNWTVDKSLSLVQDMTTDGTYLYVSSQYKVDKISATDGSTLDTVSWGSGNPYQLEYHDNLLYTFIDSEVINVYDTATLTQQSTKDYTGYTFGNAFTVETGWYYIGNGDQKVYKINSSTHGLSCNSSSALGNNIDYLALNGTTLYAGMSNGNVIEVNTSNCATGTTRTTVHNDIDSMLWSSDKLILANGDWLAVYSTDTWSHDFTVSSGLKIVGDNGIAVDDNNDIILGMYTEVGLYDMSNNGAELWNTNVSTTYVEAVVYLTVASDEDYTLSRTIEEADLTSVTVNDVELDSAYYSVSSNILTITAGNVSEGDTVKASYTVNVYEGTVLPTLVNAIPIIFIGSFLVLISYLALSKRGE